METTPFVVWYNQTMDREALAWAAGLFDGEGNTRILRGSAARMSIGQAHPEVLYRFQEAVGLGRVYGPRQSGTHTPMWVWQTTSWEDTQAVIAMLWIWLGSLKRKQAADTLRGVKEWRSRPEYGRTRPENRKTHCKRGHEFVPENTMPNGLGGRKCRTCHNYLTRLRYHRLRAT